ncbi:MAG: M23 family metallopeptidase, partial [Candidatus Komeilibacteria bacterium]|nr:M23 family metallopeptidase [Candidatus Komeilibacteria bacterium]
MLIVIVMVTMWQGLEAKATSPENFGRNTLIFALTQADEQFIENYEIVEGPLTDLQRNSIRSYLTNEAVSADDYIIEPDLPESWSGSLVFMNPDESAIEAPNISDPSLTQTTRSEVINYEVQPGDTLSNIAGKFDLRLATLLWANSMSANSVIKPGQKLVILPVDGLLYTVVKGDTLDAIGKKYKSDINRIIEANKLASVSDLQIGQKLMLPGATKPEPPKPASSPAPARRIAEVLKPRVNTPATDSGGDLLWPTNSQRITQYYGWRHSGVDIANKSGQPIYAAEAGTVITSGWNKGGYGYYIIVNHPGGFQTLYAHASKLYVKVGDKVSRGDVIAAI